ncbi:Brix-domain-containing protein [Meredithblackwellia eburnea MCA 4105]
MPLLDSDISKIRNKVVRGQLLKKQKREKAQAKLKKRIARKEAEQRGWTRTIENTKEWLGDSEEWSDPRTRPAKVSVDDETGDVRVDLGSLATLFPAQPEASTSSGAPLPPPTSDPKVFITNSPGKPMSPFAKDFCNDLQALLGGKEHADIVPRKSPKYELGKVARWARGRGYGAIAVVGEDHGKPSTLTVSLLPHGPTAHFRLTGITLCKHIPNHAKATPHPPELVLNHFSTPLGLSLASLLSSLFLPPAAASTLSDQGYQGRQVVLAQNSRDFVFVRRYRYMFTLKSHRLGKQVKKVGLDRINKEDAEEVDEVIKTRFQEIGPRFTVKMRWIRRGPLGETGDERTRREKEEKEQGVELDEEFGEKANGEAEEGVTESEDVDAKMDDGVEEERDQEEEDARKAIGLDTEDQPDFDFAGATKALQDSPAPPTAELSSGSAIASSSNDVAPNSKPMKKRKRKLPSHPLLRPPKSDSPEPEAETAPLLVTNRKGKKVSGSALSTVGDTWHAGKGEGGVREAKKRQEWGWEARMQVSRRKFFL